MQAVSFWNISSLFPSNSDVIIYACNKWSGNHSPEKQYRQGGCLCYTFVCVLFDFINYLKELFAPYHVETTRICHES